jgi:hypothetical protein
MKSLHSGYQIVYAGDLNSFCKIKIKRGGNICGIWPMDFILPIQVSVGTDIKSVSKRFLGIDLL